MSFFMARFKTFLAPFLFGIYNHITRAKTLFQEAGNAVSWAVEKIRRYMNA